MTSCTPHPTTFVDSFLKEAAKALPKPFGMGDAGKASNRGVPKGPQVYTQPNPAPPAPRPQPVAQPAAPPPVQ